MRKEEEEYNKCKIYNNINQNSKNKYKVIKVVISKQDNNSQIKNEIQ